MSVVWRCGGEDGEKGTGARVRIQVRARDMMGAKEREREASGGASAL